MKLKHIMSPVDTYFDPHDKLSIIVRAMAEKHHSCSMVCEIEKPVGILTERDVVRLVARLGETETLDTLEVQEVMTPRPITIDGDTELIDALDLARSHHLRHLPIVDHTQKLIGIVTLTDMIKAYTASIEKANDLEHQNNQLHILSIEDPLTGLPNRRAMEIDLKHATAMARRKREPFSLALIDVDHFKKFNDHYGHQAGDDALVHVAKTLSTNLRESDKIFRYGGEEFLFLMPFTGLQGAAIAADRVLKRIYDSRYTHSQSPHEYLSVSVGVATYEGFGWEEVVENADSALYEAKEKGRNRIAVYEPPEDTTFWDLNRNTDFNRPVPNVPPEEDAPEVRDQH